MSQPPVEQLASKKKLSTDKVSRWSKLASSSITNVDITTDNNREFNASLNSRELADLVITQTITTSTHVIHDPARLAYPMERVYIIHIQRSGLSQNYQDGKTVNLEPGDFTLRDSARRYVVDITGPADNLILRIPHALLAGKISNIERLTCMKMDGDNSVNALFTHTVYQLLTSTDIDSDKTATSLQKILIDLIATVYQKYYVKGVDDSSITQKNRLKVIEYIDANLSDPALNANMISAGTRFSIRYLHKLFAGQSESLGRFILRKRLEECATSLRDDMMSGYSISDIGFRWGFNSSTYFGRTFKEKYGVTPREFRAYPDKTDDSILNSI